MRHRHPAVVEPDITDRDVQRSDFLAACSAAFSAGGFPPDAIEVMGLVIAGSGIVRLDSLLEIRDVTEAAAAALLTHLTGEGET